MNFLDEKIHQSISGYENFFASKAKFSIKYDNNGNIVEGAATWESMPCNGPGGYCYTIYEYDQLNREIRQAFYDSKGNPCNSKSAYHSVASYYPSNDKSIIIQSYLDIDGRPCVNSDGAAKTKYIFDPDSIYASTLSEETYLNRDDTPYTTPEGFATILYEQSSDYETALSYWDSNREPALYQGRYFRQVWINDTIHDDLLRETSWYGVDGELTLNEFGFARVSFEFNSFGEITVESYYDIEDKLTLNTDGYARIRREYNSEGDYLAKIYYDADDNRCVGPRGYSKSVKAYDEECQLTSVQYYDQYDHPVADRDGYSEVRYEYEKELKIVERYLCHKTGQWHHVHYQYDKDQNVSHISLEPGVTLDGCEIEAVKFKYNYGEIEISYLDINGIVQKEKHVKL